MGITVSLFKFGKIVFIVGVLCPGIIRLLLGYFTKNIRTRRCYKYRCTKLFYFTDFIIHFVDSFLIKRLFPVVVVFLICTGIAYKLTSGNVDNYTYLQTELASQKDIEILFAQELDKADQGRNEAEWQHRLHIPENFVGAEISPMMFDFFQERLASIYVNGKIKEYKVLDLSDSENSEYNLVDNDYINEAMQYRESYLQTPNLATQYQYGRALTDAGMTLDDLPFSLKLEIMSDSVSILENFLSYDNRDVGDKNMPVIINTNYVALINGKLFLHNASIAAGSYEGESYANCLYVESFVCFELGLANTDSQDKYYALLSYYVGNAGEHIVNIIDKEKEPDLYKIIGEKALARYEAALECIENATEYYVRENNLENNIRNGIDTLHALGFSSDN